MAGVRKAARAAGLYCAIVVAGVAVGWAAPKAWAAVKPKYAQGDYSIYFPNAQTQVLVYGTATCPYCAKTRAWLKAHNVRFADFDIEKSPAALRQYEALGGKTAVPLVVIGDRKITGYKEAVIADAVAALAH